MKKLDLSTTFLYDDEEEGQGRKTERKREKSNPVTTKSSLSARKPNDRDNTMKFFKIKPAVFSLNIKTDSVELTSPKSNVVSGNQLSKNKSPLSKNNKPQGSFLMHNPNNPGLLKKNDKISEQSSNYQPIAVQQHPYKQLDTEISSKSNYSLQEGSMNQSITSNSSSYSPNKSMIVVLPLPRRSKNNQQELSPKNNNSDIHGSFHSRPTSAGTTTSAHYPHSPTDKNLDSFNCSRPITTHTTVAAAPPIQHDSTHSTPTTRMPKTKIPIAHNSVIDNSLYIGSSAHIKPHQLVLHSNLPGTLSELDTDNDHHLESHEVLTHDEMSHLQAGESAFNDELDGDEEQHQHQHQQEHLHGEHQHATEHSHLQEHHHGLYKGHQHTSGQHHQPDHPTHPSSHHSAQHQTQPHHAHDHNGALTPRSEVHTAGTAESDGEQLIVGLGDDDRLEVQMTKYTAAAPGYSYSLGGSNTRRHFTNNNYSNNSNNSNNSELDSYSVHSVGHQNDNPVSGIDPHRHLNRKSEISAAEFKHHSLWDSSNLNTHFQSTVIASPTQQTTLEQQQQNKIIGNINKNSMQNSLYSGKFKADTSLYSNAGQHNHNIKQQHYQQQQQLKGVSMQPHQTHYQYYCKTQDLILAAPVIPNSTGITNINALPTPRNYYHQPPSYSIRMPIKQHHYFKSPRKKSNKPRRLQQLNLQQQQQYQQNYQQQFQLFQPTSELNEYSLSQNSTESHATAAYMHASFDNIADKIIQHQQRHDKQTLPILPQNNSTPQSHNNLKDLKPRSGKSAQRNKLRTKTPDAIISTDNNNNNNSSIPNSNNTVDTMQSSSDVEYYDILQGSRLIATAHREKSRGHSSGVLGVNVLPNGSADKEITTVIYHNSFSNNSDNSDTNVEILKRKPQQPVVAPPSNSSKSGGRGGKLAISAGIGANNSGSNSNRNSGNNNNMSSNVPVKSPAAPVALWNTHNIDNTILNVVATTQQNALISSGRNSSTNESDLQAGITAFDEYLSHLSNQHDHSNNEQSQLNCTAAVFQASSSSNSSSVRGSARGSKRNSHIVFDDDVRNLSPDGRQPHNDGTDRNGNFPFDTASHSGFGSNVTGSVVGSTENSVVPSRVSTAIVLTTPQLNAIQPDMTSTTTSLIENISQRVVSSVMNSSAVSNINQKSVSSTPQEIINNPNNSAILTQFEYAEISQYPEIYFIGTDKYMKVQPHLIVPLDETAGTNQLDMENTTDSLFAHLQNEHDIQLPTGFMDSVNNLQNNNTMTSTQTSVNLEYTRSTVDFDFENTSNNTTTQHSFNGTNNNTNNIQNITQPSLFSTNLFNASTKLQQFVYEDPIEGIFNNGFDTEESSYIATKGDHIAYRYELISSLGKGSFGDVFKARDYKYNLQVAIKIVKSKERFQSQAQQELEMLDYIHPNKHKELWNNLTDSKTNNNNNNNSSVNSKPQPIYVNGRKNKQLKNSINNDSASSTDKFELLNNIIVKYLDSFMFRNHRCFVFPLYSYNLFDYLKLKDFAGLPVSFIKKVTVQLLEALKYLRQIGIIHCDLKPENILLKDERAVSIVLIDFGSACKVGETQYTYIQSRFYRAPEVLFGHKYGPEIDMWSLGCILPELRTAYPAFPGESERDQLCTIAEVLGSPPHICYEQSNRQKELFNDFYKLNMYASPISHTDRQFNSRTISSLINARIQDSLFISFLTTILHWLPEKRVSPADALHHPWLLDKFDSNAEDQNATALHELSQLNNESGGSNGGSGSGESDIKSLERMNDFIAVFNYDNEEEGGQP